MPASTRSTTKQARLEDVGAGSKQAQPTAKAKGTASKATAASKKRKADDAPKGDQHASAKKAKSSPRTDRTTDRDDVIIINRAPVLELWAAAVTHTLYPKLPWPTCLSCGSAISSLAAISKGRSIGTISRPDAGEAEAKREQRREKAEAEDLEEVEVMSFHLRLRDGEALVGDKEKKAGEEALRKKFGGEAQYGKAKEAFEKELVKWKGKEDELNGRAFGMYEDFRPNVKPGQAGWGRKGELNLARVQSVVGDV